MRILTLFVRHGSVEYATAVDDLADLFARQMPSVQWDLVIIDNALPEGHREELGPNRTLIGGSNAQWEFSSWDSAIANLGEKLAQYDLVNLATAAFGKAGAYYLSQIDAAMLQLAFQTEGIAAFGLNLDRHVVGHLNYYSDPVRIFGNSFQPWLETSFLFLPPAELKELGSLVSVTNQSGLFSGESASPFAPDAPLSANLKQHLLDSLTSHGAVPTEKLEWFQGKVVRILNEHMLSIRLAARGCTMIDGSWLASRAAESLLPLGSPLSYIPKWHGQVSTTGIQLPFVEDSSAA